MAEHKIEGLLVKFNTPWYNGTIITPEAFKSSDGAHVPVSCANGMGTAPEDIGRLFLLPFDREGTVC